MSQRNTVYATDSLQTDILGTGLSGVHITIIRRPLFSHGAIKELQLSARGTVTPLLPLHSYCEKGIKVRQAAPAASAQCPELKAQGYNGAEAIDTNMQSISDAGQIVTPAHIAVVVTSRILRLDVHSPDPATKVS
ncbi:uncharacterized protein CIMG_13389 [Coccidioides immitis RS]|uniref:Uncharacterized protein n=1 Tax=Coccidioides immitis (strain RS) TaxID=246410 RepID=A0A0D8JV60_COCIM|nr:uncharacterized protein CIMG_13389 [Coccidioides immitis RS]KJF61044.1 hypothetical protein CIMG_13389 [Coccidioides immitis RS]